MLDQLPKEVQNTLYCDFLFNNFLKLFTSTFNIPNGEKEVERNGIMKSVPTYFTWEND